MTGRWLVPPVYLDQRIRETQMAYVDGYILALEDFLKDTAEMAKVNSPDQRPIKALRKVASESLTEARAVLKAMKETPDGRQKREDPHAGSN